MANNLPKGITKRADGRFCIRVMRDGQKVTKYAKTRKEAESIHRNLVYEMEHGIHRKETRLTVDKWFDTWIETYKRPTIKASTVSTYQCYFRVHISPAIGKMRIQSVRASHVQTILNRMKDEGYSKQVLKHINDIIFGMMKQAVKEGLILQNPCEATTVPEGKPKGDRKVLTVQQQKIFLEYTKNEECMLNVFLRLQLFTGLRFGECAALQWQDIDMKEGVIHVRHTVHVVNGEDVLTTPKTKCSIRSFSLIPQAMEMLRRERTRLTSQKVISINDSRYVFNGEDGRAVYLQRLNRYLKSLCKQIRDDGYEDFPILTSHELRHTFATRFIEAGGSPQVLKEILGHSSLAITMDLYSHVLPDWKAKEMEKIAVAF